MGFGTDHRLSVQERQQHLLADGRAQPVPLRLFNRPEVALITFEGEKSDEL